MSSYKGDSRYEAHVEDDNMDLSDSSEEDQPLAGAPRPYYNWNSTRNKWKEENWEAIETLYNALKNDGDSLFGRCFLQLCRIHDFADFVYMYTMP